MILACDGIWDCKTNEECVRFLKDNMKADSKSSDALTAPLESLLDDCCAMNTDDGIGTDNMTAVLIKFKTQGT
jgi:protein phosphatase 1G